MERVDSIMERLGFKKDAEDGVKAAFVKNLIKQAYGVDVPLPIQYETQVKKQTLEEFNRETMEGKNLSQNVQQLSFDFEPKVG